jgi:hypothetical protein
MSKPIACELGVFDPPTFERYRHLRARLDRAIAAIDEETDGYALVLPGDDSTLALVAEWIALERRCCPFLAFSVSLSVPDEPIRLTIGGGAGVKAFLATELGAGVVSASALVRRG